MQLIGDRQLGVRWRGGTMKAYEVGRQIVDLVKTYSLKVTVRGGRTEASVVQNGQTVFGPATTKECEAWIYATIGKIALDAASTKPEAVH